MGKIIKTLCLLLTVLLALGWKQQKELHREEMRRELILQADAVESVVASLEPDEIAHERNLARWYNYNLEQGAAGLEEAYETILDFGGGRMAVLGVPEWELRMAIYHFSGGAVNHGPATPLPLGRQGDHTILYLTQPFPWTEGMSLYIDCLGQRLTYRVESVQEVDALRSPEGQQEEGENLLTLVFDRGKTRTLILCKRCGELVLRQGEKGARFPWAAPAAAMPVLILIWIWRGKRPRKCASKRKNWGLYRKNRGETKLS